MGVRRARLDARSYYVHGVARPRDGGAWLVPATDTRVQRGGSYQDAAWEVGVARRRAWRPDAVGFGEPFGFRCARELQGRDSRERPGEPAGPIR